MCIVLSASLNTRKEFSNEQQITIQSEIIPKSALEQLEMFSPRKDSSEESENDASQVLEWPGPTLWRKGEEKSFEA